MTAILRWFGCSPPEQKYHALQDGSPESQKLTSGPRYTSDQGDETHEALKTWERKFPKNTCETGGILKTYEYAQKILEDLLNSRTLSPSNADEIGCHLWALAKTSESKTGRSSMYHYFLENLPKVLGDENRDIAAKIHCAVIGSGNRQKYAQS